MVRRPARALLPLFGLLVLGTAASNASLLRRGLYEDGLSDKDKLAATPGLVISADEDRWQHARHVLSSLHVEAERITPPKPSLHLAKKMYTTHDYDKHVNLSESNHQKYFSLLVAWKHVLQHIAHNPDLQPHDFAIVVEDDISLHDDVTLATARAAILHGFDLARSDGWMYLGICSSYCYNGTEHVFQGLTFAKCAGVCGHGLAITKHKAATLMSDLHTTMKEGFLSVYESYPSGHAIDQMLQNYGQSVNGSWSVATNLVSPRESVSVGLLFQDKDRFHSSIDLRRRSMRGVARRILRGVSQLFGSRQAV